MSSQIIVFLSLVLSITSSLKCPYLQWNTGGAAMPCNLCLNAKDCEDDGNCTLSSYMFDCLYDSDGGATLDTYWEHDCETLNIWVSFDLTGYVTVSDK